MLCTISIHALLAESDYNIPPDSVLIIDISIHALLAESDSKRYKNYGMPLISIHALLAESDKLWDAPDMPTQEISIHALLAESDRGKFHDPGKILFLSTLSLRRATRSRPWRPRPPNNFYPRSPCGERPGCKAGHTRRKTISIHALHAGRNSQHTDFYPRSPCGERPLLSILYYFRHTFLSTLSLRRATRPAKPDRSAPDISIHALLAESDCSTDLPGQCSGRFLSTLSLRRATVKAQL